MPGTYFAAAWSKVDVRDAPETSLSAQSTDRKSRSGAAVVRQRPFHPVTALHDEIVGIEERLTARAIWSTPCLYFF